MNASKKKKKVNLPEGDPFSIDWPVKGGDKLVGGYVPRRDADYLNLLALYRGSTLSAIIREKIDEVIENGEEEEFIIRALANRAQGEWKRRLLLNQGQAKWDASADILARFREYQYEMKLRLMKRNIEETKALEIVKEMEALYGLGGISGTEEDI
jgi:hypothetical protein